MGRLGPCIEGPQGVQVRPLLGRAARQIRPDALRHRVRRLVPVVVQVDRAQAELLAAGARGAPGPRVVAVRGRGGGVVRQQGGDRPVGQRLAERDVMAQSGQRRFHRIDARAVALHDRTEQLGAAVGARQVGAERVVDRVVGDSALPRGDLHVIEEIVDGETTAAGTRTLRPWDRHGRPRAVRTPSSCRRPGPRPFPRTSR